MRLKDKEELQNPSHYKKGSIECIEAMESMLSKEEFIGFLRGNSFKYRWRYQHKDNPIKDLFKAEWYEKRLLTLLQGEHSDGSKSGKNR